MGRDSTRTGARRRASQICEAGNKMLGSRAVMLLLLLLLLQPPRLAQTRAVPEGRRPAWARGQQLSQKLCTLAWSAHPPMGHVVSNRLWH